ncbi:MAG: cobalt-precorrin 5A hydrolase [Clostridia bacterium]|nr:cobalt-precorrin 5A hydrolase [Clostridia bacterium]
MNTAVFCFSDAGAALALRLRELPLTGSCEIHAAGRLAEQYGFVPHGKISEDMGPLFSENDALIFVGACGIAVRMIAPHLRSKTEDPAVLVLDDRGRFVIPILSGHIGGANELARTAAEALGAVPVITTATDGAGRFSSDAWASSHGCAISSMEAAKAVSAAILTGDVPLSSEFPLPESLPAGLVPGDSGPLGVRIGVRVEEPFERTLRLIPKIAVLGIGCRKGISEEAVKTAVEETLRENGIDVRAVSAVASVDLKRNEAGLLAYARSIGARTVFYTAEELSAVPGEFTESEFVKKTVGVGSVCERAAALAAGGDSSSLTVKKTAREGVTVAAALMDWRVLF